MEITKREILFSTIILCVMIGLGVWLQNPILRSACNEAMETISSVKVSDSDKFDYIKRTNAGNFLAEGELSAIDAVSLPGELNGEYLKIRKDKERYTQHTQTYTTSDGKGHVTTHTRHYWSWDVIHTDKFKADSVRFLGEDFSLSDISYYASTSRDTIIKESSRIRYVYYTHPKTVEGLMTGVANDKSFSELSFSRGKSIEQVVKNSERIINSSPIVFWILWMILTAGLIFLFYYCVNEWLED